MGQLSPSVVGKSSFVVKIIVSFMFFGCINSSNWNIFDNFDFRTTTNINMKNQNYIVPSIEILEIALEKGFAASGDSFATITDWDSGNF